jgi:succinate dehydrogenase / fumarate reductase flavoprotein subunit
MLIVSEAIARAALERQESRGGHTRDDHPQMSAEWRKVNLICRLTGDPDSPRVELKRQPMEPMRTDLLELFESDELKKYLTGDELPAAAGTAGPAGATAAGTAEDAADETEETD